MEVGQHFFVGGEIFLVGVGGNIFLLGGNILVEHSHGDDPGQKYNE